MELTVATSTSEWTGKTRPSIHSLALAATRRWAADDILTGNWQMRTHAAGRIPISGHWGRDALVAWFETATRASRLQEAAPQIETATRKSSATHPLVAASAGEWMLVAFSRSTRWLRATVNVEMRPSVPVRHHRAFLAWLIRPFGLA